MYEEFFIVFFMKKKNSNFDFLVVELKSADTKTIRVRNQPRGQFRPRTENESRTSSHYIRCEDGVKPEYPTIDVN